MDKLEKEIERLHMLIEIKLQKIANMKQNIVFLQSKKVEHKNAIRFLQEIWLSGHQIVEKIREIKSWLRKLIYAQVKQGLTNE